MKSTEWILARRVAVAMLALVVLMSWLSQAMAAEHETEDALVERIKNAVIEELRDSGVLEREIDAGIERYAARQRAALQRRQQQEQQADAQNVRPVDPARDHIYGNPSAKVSLIEYSDFECPFCKRFHATAKQLVDESDGTVNWVYRHFPLGFHNPAAQREAEATECAAELGGSEAFWDYAELVFEATPSNGKGVPPGELVPLARKIGLDPDRFNSCLESGRYAERVREDFREGSSIGITGTPGNILRNNETGKVLSRSGARPIEHLRAAVAELLK